ncbi:hypothetical protein OHB54_46705 (plasmid) [Streptomyces sp. NBC_01007]|nr:hypothetical protein OHB54_46705 [Streptomyces sp. NBC_01007]
MTASILAVFRRIVLEVVATSMLRDEVSESDRLMVLADLDRLQVSVREEWGTASRHAASPHTAGAKFGTLAPATTSYTTLHEKLRRQPKQSAARVGLSLPLGPV